MQLRKKSVFIMPYNDIACKYVTSDIFKKYNFLGYVDKYKISKYKNVHAPEILKDKIYDYIIVASPKFHKNIFNILKTKYDIPKNKILFCCTKSHRLVKNLYAYKIFEIYEKIITFFTKNKENSSIIGKYFPITEFGNTFHKRRMPVNIGIEIPKKNFKSQYINTDKYSFRKTIFNNTNISVENMDKYDFVNILVGGSVVFGHGVSDKDTITSYLATITNEPWINLGICAQVSLHEYIHLIRFAYKAKKIKNIVFFSGVNDMGINLIIGKQDEFDNYFGKLNNKLLKISSFEEKYKLTIENFKRNFTLYSALKKEFQCNVLFVLQPDMSWIEKECTQIENKIYDYVCLVYKKYTFFKELNLMYKKAVIDLEKIAKSRNIDFMDSAKYFTAKETLFTDSHHLTELGNQTASDLILKKIKNIEKTQGKTNENFKNNI